VLFSASRARTSLSRAICALLFIALFTFGFPQSSFLTKVNAATILTGICSIDSTGSGTIGLIDNSATDGTCMARITAGTAGFTLPTEVNSIRTLVVGGGGGGGFGGNGGGGGAGTVLYSTSGISVTSGASISATIGNGGAAGINDADPTNQSYWGAGGNGENSTLTISGTSFVATGGGSGGGAGSVTVRYNGATGGSGGGGTISGSGNGGAASNAAYTGWTAAMNSGSNASGSGGGGGGGAGAAFGVNSSNGAIGVTIFGYAIGGGGGGWIGGTSTQYGNAYGGGLPRSGGSFPCTNGTCNGAANTGGGGGGGGVGGSGVAVIKYIPARGQGTIAASTPILFGRSRTYTYTRTNSASTGITTTFQWQVKASGSSTWNNVSSGTGGTTSAYSTAALTVADSGNSYRIAVTDTNASLAISTTTYTQFSNATIPYLDVDYALNFDGSTQFAQAADNAAFDLSNSFTFEAWIRPTEVSGYRTIVNKENSFMFYISDGVYTVSADGSSTTWSVTLNNVPAIPNEWQHVALTRTSGNANYSFYLNGVLEYSGAFDTLGTANVVNSTDPFTIGGRSAMTTQRFAGQIDNVAMYSSVRNAATIAADMNSYADPNASGLLYFFDFNEGSGTAVYNHASSGTLATDLAITGGSTYSDIKTVDNSTAYTQVKFPRTYITPIGGWRSPSSRITYNALVVAGGGAGGARVSTGAGGGGGAGGMIDSSYKTLDTSTVVSVKVGRGGLGTYTGTMSTIAAGENGGNSVLVAGATTLTAIGGGGGAGGYDSDLTSYQGKAGGSGGGASGSNTSGYAGGAAQQSSGSGYTGYGNSGGANPGCSAIRPAGGGGGAGGKGVTPTSCSPATSGAGGAGKASAITGVTYAGGGGGGTSGDGGVTAGAGGVGGGAAGGTWQSLTFSVGSVNIGNPGTANTGGGGGGTGVSTGITQGGSGGSGIVIIKYLAVALPTYTAPQNDTTTAGLTYTFTVTGSAPSPFVRTYKWQSSSDTGTTWSDINTGTGFTTASYTTPILETMTSGERYQYRVMVIDTDNGTILSDISTSAYLIINARLILNGTFTIMKYGTTHTDTFTVPANSGTGVKIIKRTSTAKPLITWDTSTANTAAVTVGLKLSAGVYYDTITVTDEKAVTTNFPITITVAKADTVTVTVASRIDTYTASSLGYTDTFTVTGLVASDTLTVSGYQYSGTANDGTVFSLAGRPAIAGSYAIIPTYSFPSFANYESVTVNSGTLTINRKSRAIVINSRPTTLKYGSTANVGAQADFGQSDGVISFETVTSSLCSISSNMITALDASGTCLYTATIGRGFNFETATSTTYSTSLTVADTLTVTVLPITPVTYTASQAVVSPRISVSGLLLSDTSTATSATFKYQSSTISDTFTATLPTNSDTYTVNASLLTLTQGLLSRYAGVTYVDGTFRINKAQQKPLYLAQYRADFGAPYKLVYFGGSGSGSVSQSVTDGTAQGCVLQTDTLTSNTTGSCLVVLTKGSEQNYETQTVTAEVFFLTWIPDALPPTNPPAGPTIVITGETSFTRNPNALPTISSLGSSGDATYPVAINGSGFTASSAANTYVKFWFGKYVDPSDFIVKSDSLIWTKVAAGASSGPISVENGNGTARSVGSFQP
jgi:Concanavalin A-like lectin/glucanases superfamily